MIKYSKDTAPPFRVSMKATGNIPEDATKWLAGITSVFMEMGFKVVDVNYKPSDDLIQVITVDMEMI